MYTALELAAVRGDESLAELAVSKGAKVAMLDPYSRTPLHLAAMYNRPEVIRILVKSGAHINATNASFETPLFQAAAWESMQAMKVLLELGADMTGADTFPPAHMLAGYGEVECMSVFIDAGLDLSFRDMLGATVLHEAVAKKDRVEMVEYLLGRGARGIINAQDHNGNTPLHAVAIQGRGADLAKLLLDNGADTKVENKLGYTSLDLAVMLGEDSMARALLEFRGNISDQE